MPSLYPHSLIPLTAALVMKVSFSLKGKAAAKSVGEAPSLKRSAAFAGLDDDEPVDAAPTAVGDKGKVAANKQFIAQSVQLSKAAKKKLEEEKKVDSTVFEYDEVWDKMQEAKAHAGSGSESESEDDSDEAEAPPPKKRRRDDAAEASTSRKKAKVVQLSAPASKDAKLSRSAQVWFGQDLFNGVGLSDVEDDEEEESEEEEGDDGDESYDDDVPGSGSEVSSSLLLHIQLV